MAKQYVKNLVRVQYWYYNGTAKGGNEWVMSLSNQFPFGLLIYAKLKFVLSLENVRGITILFLRKIK